MKYRTDALSQIRFDNAMVLFEEFVRSNVRHADAATLRGLESRFAQRLQIQPSYWSQIKGRSRQIGERLARQFEQLCRKPPGWMDEVHFQFMPDPAPPDQVATGTATGRKDAASGAVDAHVPMNDDERFILGLVLTYFRRHPQRARTRLLELLGEVLTPRTPLPTAAAAPRQSAPPAGRAAEAAPGNDARQPTAGDADALWARTQATVAPLKRKR